MISCRYVRSNVASSAGSATPLSQQQMNACRSPSSAARSLSGSVTRAPVPVLVVQGRSQSVAPPLPRVYAAPASEPLGVYDETGMSVQEVKTPAKDGGYSMEKPVPIELDPSLRDVLDGQMLSSRSRVLAMELKVRIPKASADCYANQSPKESLCMWISCASGMCTWECEGRLPVCSGRKGTL